MELPNERSVLRTETIEREYRIVRSKRKTVSLSVERSGEILVRAPAHLSSGDVARFVLRHTDWLAKKLRERENVSTLALTDGGTVRLFGEEYHLSTGKTRAEKGILYLPSEGREQAMVRFLKRLTARKMGEITHIVAAAYGFSYESVRASIARTRWGSCNRKGRIAYTFRISFLPLELAEYVAVHELCHTVVFHHGAEFWALVSAILPDWKSRRKRLKENGAWMNVL
ncbi:MAG: M48 family metallopeptidase [Clostridia bacterium]|nr:M48 family metallopeptidase [Clostridia bacterium]